MPMDFNQLELRRETLFKDAVLTSADAKSMQIIAEAQQKSSAELAQAKLACEQADHDQIMAALKRDADRDYSSAAQLARQELLQHRTELVDGLFAEVEGKLAAFAGGKSYPKWLAARAAAHKTDMPKGAKPVVFVREADLKHAAAIEKALPGCTVKPVHDIHLGGARVSDGRRLFDETLDGRLADEKQRFTLESGLHI